MKYPRQQPATFASSDNGDGLLYIRVHRDGERYVMEPGEAVGMVAVAIRRRYPGIVRIEDLSGKQVWSADPIKVFSEE